MHDYFKITKITSILFFNTNFVDLIKDEKSLLRESPDGSNDKESACSVGDPGLIPELARFPWRREGYPLQYSCLENPMNRAAWWATVCGVANSQARLSN